MPPRRGPHSARSRAGRLTSVVSVAVIVALTASGVAEGGPAGGPTEPTAAAGHSVTTPATLEPRPVTPTVTQVGVPRVPAGKAPVSLANEAAVPRGSTLAGHLIRRADGAELVGVTWSPDTAPRGLEVRLRAWRQGSWSGWTDAHVEGDEGPGAGEDPSQREGTEPMWLGPVRTIEVAVSSSTGELPRQVRLQAIDPGASSYDDVAPSASEADAEKVARKGAFPGMPDIITRKQWGVDNSLNRCGIEYGSEFKAIFVHHTVGTNSYRRSESAALVRGIHAYHTQSRGWCDIGYNFLVDRFGQIFEGRRGGIRDPVRGAHAGDYNVDSTGISLMGDFQTTTPPTAMKNALVGLVAWRLGAAYKGAYGGAIIESAHFKRISGHRDAMSTACPGERVYRWLPTLRERVFQQLGTHQTAIEKEWVRRGGPKSGWGPVRRGEWGENGGRHTLFRGGRMYRFDGGVWTFRTSPLLSRYVASGEVHSDLGYPVGSVRRPRGGRAADFQHGSIYSSRATGSRILKTSSILKRYRSLKGAVGPLAFPESPVLSYSWGAKVTFQQGVIRFSKSKRRVMVTYR